MKSPFCGKFGGGKEKRPAAKRGGMLSCHENTVYGFGDRGAHNKTDERFNHALHADEQYDEHERIGGAEQRNERLNIFRGIKAYDERTHEEHGVQNRSCQRSAPERKPVRAAGVFCAARHGTAALHIVQSLENQTCEPSGQNSGRDAHNEGQRGIDSEQSGAERTAAEAGAEAGQAEDTAENGPAGRPEEDRAERYRDHQERDLQSGGAEIPERRVGQNEFDGGKQSKPYQRLSAYGSFHILFSPLLPFRLSRIQRKRIYAERRALIGPTQTPFWNFCAKAEEARDGQARGGR